MSEAKKLGGDASKLKPSNDELRWRMEKVVQHACATGVELEASAGDFNKALATLRGQGDELEAFISELSLPTLRLICIAAEKEQKNSELLKKAQEEAAEALSSFFGQFLKKRDEA